MTTVETRAQALIERVEADSSHLVDPLVLAATSALKVVELGRAADTKSLVAALNEVMPSSTTVLERGLAIGMVLGLQAEPTP